MIKSKVEYLRHDVKSKNQSNNEELENYRSALSLQKELIKPLLSIGMDYIKLLMQKEVELLTGEKYERDDNFDFSRWGYQGGSVYVGEQKVRLQYPRVRDMKNNREVSDEL